MMAISEFSEKFCRIKSPDKIITYRKSFIDASAVDKLANNIDQILSSSSLIKDEENVKAGIATWNNKKIFIKKYLRTGFFYKIKDFFRISRPMKVFKVSSVLEGANILFPKVLMVVEKRKSELLRESYLVLEAVEDLIKKENYNEVIFGSKDALKLFFTKVINLISDAHNLNISHGDCKLSNFYLSNYIKSDYQVGLFDLDGARIHLRITTKKRVKDFSRFFASVCEYCQRNNVYFFMQKETLNTFFILFSRLYEKNTGVFLGISDPTKVINKLLKRKQIFVMLE